MEGSEVTEGLNPDLEWLHRPSGTSMTVGIMGQGFSGWVGPGTAKEGAPSGPLPALVPDLVQVGSRQVQCRQEGARGCMPPFSPPAINLLDSGCCPQTPAQNSLWSRQALGPWVEGVMFVFSCKFKWK